MTRRVHLEPHENVQAPPGNWGACRRCHQFGELGQGLCVNCWDKRAERSAATGIRAPVRRR
jgi:hypothetical protein